MDIVEPPANIGIAAHYGGVPDDIDLPIIIDQPDFLKEIAPADLEDLINSDATEVRVLDQRQRLFEQDTPLTTVFLVLEGSLYQGRVSEEDGKRRLSLRTTLKPGKIAGLYDMLYRLPHSATVRATEPSRVLAIDAAAIGRLLARYPNLRGQIAPVDEIARLRTIPFFADQGAIELCFVADACAKEEYAKGETLYRAGDEIDKFYIIDQGQAHLTASDQDDLWLGNGTVLGVGQLGTSPYTPAVATHTATITAPSRLFAIKREILLGIMAIDPARVGHKLREEINDTVHRLAVFRNYTPKERRKLIGYMNYFSVADKSRLLMQQGEIGDSFWLLMPNRRATVAALNSDGQAIARTKLYGPIYFSELALRAQRPIKSTVNAEINSQWLRLHWKDFRVFLKETDSGLARKLVLTENLDSDDDDDDRDRYSWLQEGEVLELFCRRHWIALASRIILPFFLSLLLVLLWLGSIMIEFSLFTQSVIFGPLTLILLALWSWFVADYMNDYLIVTNLRVMRQEKVVMVNEQRQSASLNQVQNVDVTANFLGNILGYADVNIQTSGSTGSIIFDRVSNAEKIRTTISAMRGHQEGNKGAEGKIVIQQVLEERLGLGLEIPSRVRVDADKVLNAKTEGSRFGNLLGISKNEQNSSWNESEKIVWRKHWFILIGQIMPALLLFGASLIVLLAAVAAIVGANAIAAEIPLLGGVSSFIGPAVAIPALLVWLGSVAWAGWLWADWRNDTYEIDGDEVIDVEKTPLFTGEQRRSARLGDIENVRLEIASPIHYILNFGNVILQTAAADGEFTFDHVPNPRAVAEEVRRRIQKFEREQEEKQARKNARDLPDWFETYNRLDASRSEFEEETPLSALYGALRD